MWKTISKKEPNSFCNMYKQKLTLLNVSLPSTPYYFYPNHSYDFKKIENELLSLCHTNDTQTHTQIKEVPISSHPTEYHMVNITPNERLSVLHSCLHNMTTDAMITEYPEREKRRLCPIKESFVLHYFFFFSIIVLLVLYGSTFKIRSYKMMYALLAFFIIYETTVRMFRHEFI